MNILNPLSKSDGEFLNIIVVGCGNVGVTITDRLSSEGHHVTVIDKNAPVLKEICSTYDVMGVVGNGASYNVQMEAGVENADLIIAVTPSDELNLLCCTMAQKFGNCASIARVRNPDYAEELSFIRSRLGLSMIINPDLEASREIARLLRLPGATSINSFARGHAEMVQFKISEKSPLIGKALRDLQSSFSVGVLVCAVDRGGEIFIPGGSFAFAAGDAVSFIATPTDTQKFFKKLSIETRRVKSAMLVGGGRLAYYLAKQLLESGIAVKIIERRSARCTELAELLDGAEIICGDGTDESLLRESGLAATESFIPLTGIDEENILLTLYAKKNTSAKVITKINRMNFHDVIAGLDMDSVVYPRFITAESIIAYARARQNSIGSNIETLYHLFDNRAEAIEFRIAEPCEVTGKPIMQLPLKKDLLIACIYRSGRVIIPSGHDSISVGDTVIIVTKHSGFHEIGDILS
ncbi:MAG: Trk system potassium transporter TrkA [Clostridia bacterium]|nr:Trk system potassium transporter TrkA [Clostridia bacterium]